MKSDHWIAIPGRIYSYITHYSSEWHIRYAYRWWKL